MPNFEDPLENNSLEGKGNSLEGENQFEEEKQEESEENKEGGEKEEGEEKKESAEEVKKGIMRKIGEKLNENPALKKAAIGLMVLAGTLGVPDFSKAEEDGKEQTSVEGVEDIKGSSVFEQLDEKDQKRLEKILEFIDSEGGHGVVQIEGNDNSIFLKDQQENIPEKGEDIVVESKSEILKQQEEGSDENSIYQGFSAHAYKIEKSKGEGVEQGESFEVKGVGEDENEAIISALKAASFQRKVHVRGVTEIYEMYSLTSTEDSGQDSNFEKNFKSTTSTDTLNRIANYEVIEVEKVKLPGEGNYEAYRAIIKGNYGKSPDSSS